MATTDSCANCARGLTFPLSPIHKGWQWDQVPQRRKWKSILPFKHLEPPPCFHIYFTLGLLTNSRTFHFCFGFSGMLGFICFWLFLLLRIYLPESYWSWSETHLQQWATGSWNNWKLYGRFQTSFNSTHQIFSKYKRNG